MMVVQYIFILMIYLTTVFANNPVRIMPLGDSITAGSYGAGENGIGGYRAPLWKMLEDENIDFDFVGTLNDPRNATFDTGHEGWPGWRVDQLNDSVAAWISKTSPDVILLQIGVNDLLQGADVQTVSSRLDKLIGNINAEAPGAKLFVSSIMDVLVPNYYKVSLDSVKAYNAQIPVIVKKYNSKQIWFVDINSKSNLGSDDFSEDRLHPNDSGYLKMANAWKQSLLHIKLLKK